MRKHRWVNDVCTRCGVERETVNGRYVYHAYTHKTYDRPECREHKRPEPEEINPYPLKGC